MKRLYVLAALGLLGSALALSQTPRDPVILVPRPGGSPAPAPLPDPSGVYGGNATITDANGTVTQQWNVAVKARPCPDCETGQYWTFGSNFDGTVYTSGRTERGGVYGTINSDGTAVDLSLEAINCLYVNESSQAPVTATVWGGSFGRVVVPRLQIRDGRIRGSLSGWDCFGRPYVVAVDLARHSSSPPADCSLRGGWYYGTFANSRGQSGSGWIYIRQSNCYFSTRAEDFGVNLEGIFSSSTSISFRLSGIGSCDAVGSGSGSQQANGTVVGSYTGTINSGCGVLSPGPISGSFTFVPE
jgi:hypothetical protein